MREVKAFHFFGEIKIEDLNLIAWVEVVCVFLYFLQTRNQNTNSTTPVRTFLENVKARFGFRFGLASYLEWLGSGKGAGLHVMPIKVLTKIEVLGWVSVFVCVCVCVGGG